MVLKKFIGMYLVMCSCVFTKLSMTHGHLFMGNTVNQKRMLHQYLSEVILLNLRY